MTNTNTAPDKARSRPPENGTGTTDQIETTGSEPTILTQADCYSELGFCFSPLKKWTIIWVIFLVQTSMNFNTSLYSNAIGGISKEFNVSEQAARCGAMIFLVLYAFGCELWAPWSEEFGRKPILQLSLFLVNIWQIPVGIAPNFATIMVGRALGGISTAGGSITLGMIADLWEADDQGYAVACVVFSSVGGSVLGPVVGGFVEAFLPWRWNIWIQLIFGGGVQLAHFFLVPETRTSVLVNQVAKRRRAKGENVYGLSELVPLKDRFSAHELMHTWLRPFRMLITEPIVLCLSLLSGFTDALIFVFIQSFSLVYGQWDFGPWQVGLSFLPLMIGYAITWILVIPVIKRNIRLRQKHYDERAQYESRLWWLLYTAPCLPIGLIGFAWTSLPQTHWIGSMIFQALVGIANFSIFMATIDYMICAYGDYAASATGGNGWARDFLAGVLTVPATPFYESRSTLAFCFSILLKLTNIPDIGGKYHLEYASTILCKSCRFSSFCIKLTRNQSVSQFLSWPRCTSSTSMDLSFVNGRRSLSSSKAKGRKCTIKLRSARCLFLMEKRPRKLETLNRKLVSASQ